MRSDLRTLNLTKEMTGDHAVLERTRPTHASMEKRTYDDDDDEFEDWY